MKAQIIESLCWILALVAGGSLWRLKTERALIAEMERQIRNQKSEIRNLPPTVEWTADNVLALRKFFAEETGQKLIELCGGHALAEAMREAHGDRATPQAAGMDALLRFQFNLASNEQLNRISRAAGAQVAITGEGDQDDADSAAHRSF